MIADAEYMNLDVLVTNQLGSGSTFGIHVPTGAGVFINSKGARHHNLRPGDVASTRVVPNKHENSDIAWYACYVEGVKSRADDDGAQPAEAPADPVEVQPVEAPADWHTLILDTLRDGPASTAQVAAALGVTTYFIAHRLNCLHEEGRIALAIARQRAGQVKASHMIWALKANEFVPEEMDQ